MKKRTRADWLLAGKRSLVTYGIGAMVLGMASVGNVHAATVTVPELSTDTLVLDVTPVRDIYNMTISASLGMAAFRKAGVAAKKW